MTNEFSLNRIFAPNIKIICAVCVAQILMVALPFYFSQFLSAILVLALISVIALVGSPALAVFYLCFIAAIIPTWVYDDFLTLPMDFKFYEGIFAFILCVCVVMWMLKGRLDWQYKTRLDRPMLTLLGLIVFSIALGLFYGQSTSQMLRDVRYPLCYGLFFVVTWFVNEKKSQAFIYVVIGAAVVVGIEYIIEFLTMVNLSLSGSFFRVARLEGVLLPIGILSVVSVLLLERRYYLRILIGLALLPIGMALLLTVGRGMWIGLIVGLGVLGYLTWIDPVAQQRRRARLGVVLCIPIMLILMTYFFQTQTSTGVGDVAVRRISRVAENYEQDHSIAGRLVVYGIAFEEFIKHPILGGGHGVSIRILSTDVTPPVLVTVGGVDSVYLTIAMRMGVVGVGIFLWVFGSGLWRAYQLFLKTREERVRVYCMAFMAVYSALLVFGIGDATLFVNRLIFIHATFLGILARLDMTYGDTGSAVS